MEYPFWDDLSYPMQTQDVVDEIVDEYLVGYSKQMTNEWTLKTHARYRYGFNFWEDTNNNARSRCSGASDRNTHNR